MMRALILSLSLAAVSMGGDLPQLNESPWEGWYVGTENRDFRMGVNRDGELVLMPFKGRNDLVPSPQYLVVTPVIVETPPGGRPVGKKVAPSGWEAVTASGLDPEKIVYRGTVTGGAKFEVVIEPTRDGFRAGGRVIEAGTLKNPLKFSLRCRLPDPYRYQKNEEKLEKDAAKDDYLFVHMDGKKVKLDGVSKVDASTEEVMGKGLKEVAVEFGPMDAEVEITLGEAGILELWNSGERPLYKGLSVNWVHDPEKDPEAKARFEVKWK